MSNSKNYSLQAFYSSQSHTGAEREFLLSRYEDAPIAMLVESSYWENEASEFSKSMESDYGDEWAQKNRRFGMLPIPKFIGTEGVPDQTNTETLVQLPPPKKTIVRLTLKSILEKERANCR